MPRELKIYLRNDNFCGKSGLSSFGRAASGAPWVCGVLALRQVGLCVSLASSAESWRSGFFGRLANRAARVGEHIEVGTA